MATQLGCFGSVIYHDAEARRCSNCPMLEACKQQVTENKSKIEVWYKDLVNTSKSQRKTRKMVSLGSEPIAQPMSAPTSARTTTAKLEPDPATAHLNKKPREFVDRWNAKGINYKAYKEGQNGFTHCGNKFAGVAMQFFMDNPGGVTKLQLTDELIAKLGWGCGTAGSHAGIILEAFEHLGIITTTGGKAYLR